MTAAERDAIGRVLASCPNQALPSWSFEEHRPHLLRVGYRITGSFADAEDAVQEAWLRWNALGDEARAELRDERAWLATVVGRVCLDRLRSAAARRERYVGPWLPEPLVTTPDDDGPLAAVVRDESVRMAAMVVLERLSPPQRVALGAARRAGPAVRHDRGRAGLLGGRGPPARHAGPADRRGADATSASSAPTRRPRSPASPTRSPAPTSTRSSPCCIRTPCW